LPPGSGTARIPAQEPTRLNRAITHKLLANPH
jgi:hypothetical protein